MPSSFAELSDAVLALPTSAKEELAERLIASLVGDTPAGVHAAQVAEVMRRRQEWLDGKVRLVPGEQVMREVRERLQR